MKIDINSVQSNYKNKFTLHTFDRTNEKLYKDDQTFIDVSFNQFKDRGVVQETRDKIKLYFEQMEFDADSLNDDIVQHQNISNIL